MLRRSFEHVLFCGLVCAAGIALAEPGVNLLINPGFEQGTEQTAEGWHSGVWGGAKAVHGRTSSEVHGGTHSYYLEFKSGKGGLQLFPDTSAVLSEADRAANRIVVSGWYRGNANPVTIQVRYFRDEDGKANGILDALGGRLCHTLRLPPSRAWQHVEETFTPPKRTKGMGEVGVRPYVFLTAPDTIYIDDLAVHLEAVKVRPASSSGEDLLGDFSRVDFLPVAPFSAEQKAQWGPPTLPPFKITVKDGILLKDGRPVFFLGIHEGGGGQFAVSPVWFPRVFRYDFVEANTAISRTMRVQAENERLTVDWKELPYTGTWLRELYRNNTFVWYDVGSSGHGPNRLLGRWPELVPGLSILADDRYGHFYPADHMHPLGRQLYKEHWKAWFKYAKGLPFLTAEVFNELGYWCTSPLTLQAFREWMKTKYGEIGTLNGVLGTTFPDWSTVAPPHIWERFKVDYKYHQYRMQQMQAYPDLWNDWLEFLRHNFVTYLKLMKQDFREVADCPFSVDSRYSRIEDHFSYSMVDPELVSEVTDIQSFHVTGYVMYDYEGKPAEPDCVMNSLIKPGHCHDYMRAAVDDPIMNPENIISTCRVPGLEPDEIVESSLVNLHRPWKFRTDPDQVGEKQGWFGKDLDASAWGEIEVPGVWEEKRKDLEAYDGWAWYRTRFVMPKEYEWTARDGSVRYLLYGQGLDDAGVIYINGKEVHRGAGWKTIYAVNLNPHISFGKENTIAIRINDTTLYGGLRFFVTIIGDTMMARTKELGPDHLAAMIWSNAVHGMSGMDIWDWGDDMVRTYIPRIKADIDSVSDILLPRPRIKGNVGLFYSWESFDGLFRAPPESMDLMEYYGALLFNHVPLDMVTNRGFLDGRGDAYPLIVFPYCHYIRQGTFDKLKAYVAAGGTAVLTYNAFQKDMYRYQTPALAEFIGAQIGAPLSGKTSVTYEGESFPVTKGAYTKSFGVSLGNGAAEALATYKDGTPAVVLRKHGRGKVAFIGAELGFRALYRILGDLMAQAGLHAPVDVTSANGGEFPYIESQVVGDSQRFLLYLVNWGGLEHPVRVRFTDAWGVKTGSRYHVRHVQERSWEHQNEVFTGAQLRDRGLNLSLDSYAPQTLLFESVAVEPPTPLASVSGKRQAIMARFDRMKQAPDADKPRVVFLKREGRGVFRGKFNHPLVVQLLEEEGFGVCELSSQDIAAGELSGARLLVLAEDDSLPYKWIKKQTPTFYEAVRTYLKGGGRLLFCGSASVHYNARNLFLRYAFGKDPRVQAVGGGCSDPAHCSFGDPNQIRVEHFAEHPLTQHVNSLQFTLATTLSTEDDALIPVAFTAEENPSHPSAPVALAGTVGKGKAVLVGDCTWMQPFRVEHADNAQFLVNCLRWLTDRPIERRDRNALVQSLFITEKIMREIEREER